MNRYFLPLLVFCLLTAALFAGLSLDPSRVPSPLIGKAAPSFSLPPLDAGAGEGADDVTEITEADFLGEVWLLNVWASWCAACLEEHPLLMRLLKDDVKLVGLNYKDEAAAARQWLAQWGDPYALSLQDAGGDAGLDWGVYGVPETFVIDRKGIVRHKHIGPLARRDIKEELLPIIRNLQAEAE